MPPQPDLNRGLAAIQQLLAGCTPRLSGEHTAMVMAQMEVAAGCVTRADPASDAPVQCRWQR
jgi:hypothetical protein